MMHRLRLLAADKEGSSATEMAMSLPILLALLFGAVELGYYFMSEHVVQKGVRDAARYAARLPMSSYPSCTPTADAELAIQRVARAGDPDGDWNGDGTQDQRIGGWDADAMTTVTMTCDTSGTYTGIYKDFPEGVPIITVSAAVPYPSLFGTVGFPVPSIMLNAQSQTAGFGA